jgi:hypothetical protein
VTTRTQAALLDAVDRAYDLAEKSLAAQRQLAHTLVGAAERQADALAETVESTSRQTLREVQDTVQAEADEPKPRKQEPKLDRRPFEERSLEELRERARELDIEGRSAMSKDELVAALRKQSR